VYGYVGNKAATFPLQLLGYEVDPINTVQFSNHTQYKCFTGLSTQESIIDELFRGLITNGFALEYSHVLTGYVGKAGSLTSIAKNIKQLKELNPNLKIVIDPVLGDNNKLYVPSELIPLYRDLLLPISGLITPNGFEAEMLTGMKPKPENIKLVLQELHRKGPDVVIITSVVVDDLTCMLYGSSKVENICFELQISLRKEFLFTGTGDTFAASLLAHLEDFGILEASERAVDTMYAILEKTLDVRKNGCELAIVQSASLILNPQRLHKARVLF
jgi:pyridoxine kinase